ncbi:MAG TPA: K(+)-transporting ATPase subunit C [Verrucomicrobiae bacterium]|nr:K(+)-transporting ATPase subunit C [Verrucomicrobiae bacterium]
MKAIISEFGRSIAATIFFALIVCGVYPLVVFGLGRVMFTEQANGSLLIDNCGRVRGSKLLGQNFTGDKYFHPRPSAAGNNGYDPMASGGSNLGPTSGALFTNIRQNIAAYRSDNAIPANVPVPADAVTESGSGLDPDISLANAEIQIARVARARRLSPERVRELVRENTSGRDWGLFGEPRVNVMTLNFALDGLEK